MHFKEIAWYNVFMYTIYRVISPNGKTYIGYTSKSLENRKRLHFANSRLNKDNIYYFHRAIRKYGAQLEWSTIDTALNKTEACQKEIFYIKQYKSHIAKFGYNSSLGGEGGGIPTLKTKRKIAKKLRNNPNCAIGQGGKPFLVYTKNGKFIGRWEVQATCARELKISQGLLSQCLLLKRKYTGSYVFVYEDQPSALSSILSNLELENSRCKAFIVYDANSTVIMRSTSIAETASLLGLVAVSIGRALKNHKIHKGYKFLYEHPSA